MRSGEVTRKTKETNIKTSVVVDGDGNSSVNTSLKFLDHMIDSLGTHSLMNIQIEATGDLVHHTVEDVALSLGEAINKALGDRKGIKRFGFAMIPMDDALSLIFTFGNHFDTRLAASVASAVLIHFIAL